MTVKGDYPMQKHTKTTSVLTHALAHFFILLFGSAFIGACSDATQHFACVYDYSVYSVSEWGTSFKEYRNNCVDVESEDECAQHTEDSIDCIGTHCADWTYFNVKVVEGTCEELTSGG